jgi:hypothetical protein
MILGDTWICICGSLVVALGLLGSLVAFGSLGDALVAYM